MFIYYNRTMAYEPSWILLFLLLPLAAFLYASVGHGGASSYLMLLALFGFPPSQIRPAALIMNMLVAGFAFLSYRKTCRFSHELFWPLVLFSIPAAFLGGTIAIDAGIYKKLLGLSLLFPIMRFLNLFPVATERIIERRDWMIPVLGAVIGFASGLIGIGGGIILSPVLLMTGWADLRETATLSALFIFLNSAAGFLGANPLEVSVDPELWLLMPGTILAGFLGAWHGAFRFHIKTLKYLLTVVLIFASFKLLLA